MKKKLLTRLLLILTGMAGSNVTIMAQSPEPDGSNEVVEIATAEDLNTFAQRVEQGEGVDGLLTADIDLSESDYPDLMIGVEGNMFTGTFDGQGHTITYHYLMVTDKWRGLFAYIDGATIRNLIVEGSAVTTNIHYGALIGVAYGTVLVENVVTNVDVTGQRGGVTGDAGMLGANYADITFNNCAVLGPLGYPGSSMYSPFSGWSNGSSHTTLNNCYAASEFKEGTGIDGNSATLSHAGGPCVFNNCYYLNFIDKEQGTQVTEEQITNGALCYKLNSGQTDIVWTQDLDDPGSFPMPNPNGKRVYASGTCRCDGAELEDNPLTYSNTESYPVKPDHQFGSDGICIICGTADPDAVKKNEEGFYLIGNAKQLNWLNQKILEGETDSKVLLTDDIDLSESDYPDLMIGTESKPFGGLFDGAGHTITYDYAEVTEKWRGLFAFVKDATIRNLRVEGSAFVTQIHYGALIGRGDGTILVENVVTNVDITGAMNQVTGDAGMIGANYAHLTFNNCATLGEMGYPGSSMYSPFSGWSHADSYTILNNCFTTCKLKEDTGTGNCFTMTHRNGHVTINNCYYLNLVGTYVGGTQITEEQLESGELCYLLNGDQSEMGWYQALGEDEMPVPDANHPKVYGAGKTFLNITDDASFKTFVALVIEEETGRYEEMKTQKSLVESYLEALEVLRTSANIDAFLSGYAELAGQRDSIQSCAVAYTAYMAKVEEAKKYLEEHPDLVNLKAEQLRTYLTEYDEPNEDFPHGSAVLILEECELNKEEIIAETALIDAKLVEAITYTPSAGTEVTMLFTNADLSDKFNGWEGQLPTGWGGSETSPLYAAECLVKTMDMYQTLTELPNGIYELQVNGAFRPTPHNYYYNVNYAATLYANGVHNYFMTNIEDMINVEDAIDGENCNITGPVSDFAIEDEDGNVIGYTMQGIVSCCNAFQAGRYPNSILCKVTDGTLTIGVRQPGTGLSRDWLGFGNIKVFYYGQMNEADESLDRVLASMSDRATTILEVYEPDIYEEYTIYPNFSQALKDQLRETLDAVATTTEPEEKYKLVEKFSSLFLQIYECKQAYVTLMEKAEQVTRLQNAFYGIVSDSEYDQMDKLYNKLTDAYVKGTMTAEEALAIDLKKEISFYPDEEDGYYLIRNQKDYIVFANMVNAGSTQINAKLFADIDLSDSDCPDQMIGLEEAPFEGIFDGQGHTITYSYDFNANYCGLFSYIKDATIRNLRVEGDVVTRGIHYGALIGYGEGTMLVENVITNVNIIGERGGVTGNGGMIGALYGDITFNNCATLGEMGYPGSSMYCGFTAFATSGVTSTLNNCYTTCLLTEDTGTDYCFTFCRGDMKLNNCYYLNQIGTAQGKQMSLEQFQNGEVCYKLNGDQSTINWFQTIGTDKFPVLDDTHQVVFKNEDGSYGNQLDEDGIDEVKNERVKNEGVAAEVYDLSGRKITNSKLSKGIYIVNGKKVLK
ncbi:MAG: hypothetical protein J6W52_12105 [Bacteroidaceae bacterium]|nr:hypothetical protein [Bacteroidaceae bacterium]